MKASLGSVEFGVVLVVAAGAAYWLWKHLPAAQVAGYVSGDNALTKTATNAAGQPVTAYQGAGPLGTLGAAANAVSGGVLATFGGWLGGAVYDLTHPGQGAAATAPTPLAGVATRDPAAAASAARWQTGGIDPANFAVGLLTESPSAADAAIRVGGRSGPDRRGT